MQIMRASCSFARVSLRADKSKRRSVRHATAKRPRREVKLPATDDSDVTVENKAVTRQYGYWYRALAARSLARLRAHASTRVSARCPRDARGEAGLPYNFGRQFLEVQRHVDTCVHRVPRSTPRRERLIRNRRSSYFIFGLHYYNVTTLLVQLPLRGIVYEPNTI